MQTTSEPSDLEDEIRKAMDTGRPLDLQADHPDLNAVEGSTWGQACTVSGELLAALLTTPISSEKAPPRGLRVRGARIIGIVDLEGTRVNCPLELRDCWLERPPNVMAAQFPLLRLPGCSVPGLDARSLIATATWNSTEGLCPKASSTFGRPVSVEGLSLATPAS